jgi:GNAT superfamily N-acetyltransferase
LVPVFDSFEQVFGRSIFQLVYPDWQASQAKAVAVVCQGPHVWVAVDRDQPVGFVAVVLKNDEPRSAEIDMLAVDPDHQRHGVGTSLVEVAVDFARGAGVRIVDVATGGDPGHAAARRVYEGAGFIGLPLVRYYKAL